MTFYIFHESCIKNFLKWIIRSQIKFQNNNNNNNNNNKRANIK